MLRSHLLVGLLSALFHTVSGLVFRDYITQNVDGETLHLQQGYKLDSVVFSERTGGPSEHWEFDTSGFPDDVAIIQAVGSPDFWTLVCKTGEECKLDETKTKHPFRVSREDPSKPFTFQDLNTGLFVSRASDRSLKLTETVSDASFFTLKHIETPLKDSLK